MLAATSQPSPEHVSPNSPTQTAILWDSSIADVALWAQLHRQFTEPEFVELGVFIALMSGQKRWIKSLSIGHHEILGAPTSADRRSDLKMVPWRPFSPVANIWSARVCRQ
ncbi:hypothetical protein ACFLRH_00165 [Actinomycetota bacterium]